MKKNLDALSTRTRTLAGFPVIGATKRTDLQDDLNKIKGVSYAASKPHYDEEFKDYDYVLYLVHGFDEASQQQVKELCDQYGATYIIDDV